MVSEVDSISVDTGQVCDVCGDASYLVFATKGRGVPVRTVICRGCGLVYTNPRPTAEQNAEFYHQEYWGQYKDQSMPDERFFLRRLPKIRFMAAQVVEALGSGMRVLEVGSSVGALLWTVRGKTGDRVRLTGIEPHSGHARFAREKKSLDVRTGLLEEVLPQLHGSQFDVIVMNHVLEHTVSPTQVLESLKPLLRPGGLFLIEVPNIENPGSRLSHFFHVAHHFNFSPATLSRLARKTGYLIRKMEALDGDLPGTRLFAVLENAAVPAAQMPSVEPPADDAGQRSESLRNYERWYWLTAASLRKKVTHWLRHR